VHPDLFFSNVADLKKSRLLKYMRIDLVTGGFPCQAVSYNNVHTRSGFQSKVLLYKRTLV
jgi:site-specific DNA-cytosine methylase